MKNKPSMIFPYKVFGEMCVARNSGVKAKLENQGSACLWLGYAENHANNTHRVYSLDTEKVHLTQDLTFLRENQKQVMKEQEGQISDEAISGIFEEEIEEMNTAIVSNSESDEENEII